MPATAAAAVSTLHVMLRGHHHEAFFKIVVFIHNMIHTTALHLLSNQLSLTG